MGKIMNDPSGETAYLLERLEPGIAAHSPSCFSGTATAGRGRTLIDVDL
jgi:hypothetical protein